MGVLLLLAAFGIAAEAHLNSKNRPQSQTRKSSNEAISGEQMQQGSFGRQSIQSHLCLYLIGTVFSVNMGK
jgi:hypothetical protein